MLERYIQNELNKLDLDLFLDKDWYGDTLFWTVKYSIGSGHPPLTVVEWAVGGHPLPLSTSIVDKVKQQEGDIREAIRSATVNNAIQKARVQKEADEIMETISDEFEKSAKRLHLSGPWSPGKDTTAYKKPS